LREQISPAETAGSTDLTGLWTKVVEAVGRVSQFTRSYLLEAHPVSFNKNLLTIGFDPEFEEHLGLVDNPRNHTLLQTKLTELGHPNAQIKFIKAPAPSAAPEVAPQPAPAPQAAAPATPKQAAPAEKTGPLSLSPEDFKNDPLIQRALEMFRGQIVQVRA
jgi:DNA polymerase-3 subunit gamma/tau